MTSPTPRTVGLETYRASSERILTVKGMLAKLIDNT